MVMTRVVAQAGVAKFEAAITWVAKHGHADLVLYAKAVPPDHSKCGKDGKTVLAEVNLTGRVLASYGTSSQVIRPGQAAHMTACVHTKSGIASLLPGTKFTL